MSHCRKQSLAARRLTLAIVGTVWAILAGCGPKPAAPAKPALPNTAKSVSPTVPAGAHDLLVDVSAAAGIQFVHQLCDDHVANILESNGAGGAVLDVDGDGWMDIFLVNSGPLDGVTHHAPGTRREPNRLFRNRRDGTFEDITESAGLGGTGYGVAATAADFDNDGDPDLYVVNVGRNLLYRNLGQGRFEEVAQAAGVADPGTGIGAVFVDVDNDGFLDLFVANYLQFDPDYRLYFQPDGFPNALAYKPQFNALYRNRGDGTFEDISERAGIRLPGHRAMSVTAWDYDLDGDQDFYISNDLSENLLLANDGQGRFQNVALSAGVAFNAMGEAAGSMGATIGDANGDGLPDILVTRFGYGSLYLAGTNGIYRDHLMGSGIGAMTAQFVAWGGVFLDFDNDRDEDIFIANGDAHYLVGWQSLLLENAGDATFTDAADKGGAFFQAKLRGRAATTLDFDNNGRPDLLMTTLADRAFLLKNTGASNAHWLLLKLEGTRSNRDGFGAIVEVRAKGRTTVHLARAPVGFLIQGDPRLHVGLADADRAERLEVRWPSGQRQVLENVPADQILTLREPEGEAPPPMARRSSPGPLPPLSPASVAGGLHP